MVNALVKLNDETNRVLNSVKAIYGLKDKGEAIEFVVEQFSEMSDEPRFKESFLVKITKAKTENSLKIDSFTNRYGL